MPELREPLLGTGKAILFDAVPARATPLVPRLREALPLQATQPVSELLQEVLQVAGRSVAWQLVFLALVVLLFSLLPEL